jgi:WD40 repeat protein
MEDAGIIAALLAFLDTLPAGFGCGPREQLAVRELVLRLIAGGEKRADPAQWKTLIGPLVCGDPDQQREFYDRFDEWIASRTVSPPPPPPPPESPRRWIALAAATLLVCGLFGGGAWYKSRNRPKTVAVVQPLSSEPATPPVPTNQLQGTVRAPDGHPLGNATVWIPFGIETPQYPKVATDARGSFTITLTSAPADNVPGTLSLRDKPLVLRYGGVVTSVSFSPDGSRLATDTVKGAVIRDTITGKEIVTTGEHSDSVWSVSFSPDGQRLATGSEDKTAKIWDAAIGKELLTFRGHSGSIEAVAFSPDGRTLATASEDSTAKTWDAATGKEIRTFQGHSGPVRAVAFSPDGRTLATAGTDKTAKIWDAATGKEILTLRGHLGAIRAVAFSPAGRTLATASFDNTAKIWDAATGKEMLTLQGHSDNLYSVAFSPDGRNVATASADKTAKIWNAATGKDVLTLRGHTNVVRAVAFSSDGRRFATASTDDTVRLWSLSATPPASSAAVPPAGLTLLITHADYEPAYVENAAPGVFSAIKLGPLKAAQRVLTFAPNPPRPPRRFPRSVSFALALLPLSLAFLLFRRQRKRDQQRKAFLDQWETHLDLEPVRVHTRSEEDDLFQGVEVATLARELRRRRPEPTSQLAVESTVRATAARAGLFTPVRRQRFGAREYLVLLESKGGRDQQAHLWTCLLDRLAAQEVWLDRYSFSGDPRVCEVSHAHRGWVRLEEIAALHPRHELWIVSTAQRFFEPTSRQPAPWVPALARWPERAVLSLAGGSAEDREQLAALGFTMAGASVAGLAELNNDAAHPPGQGPPASYPLLLDADESRWLQGQAPAGESGARELRSLDRQLRAWLGGNGYRCLLACAVYPGLAWNLTLHLALALIPAEEREQTLARLVRLPWFRHGRMPQWLRAFFTEKLDPDEASRVLALLRDFLERKSRPDAGLAPGLEFARREIAADLRAQHKPPTRDYVFLSFLLHRKPRLRDLEAPAWLRRLFFPQGLPVLRLRRELWLALGLLVGGFVYWGAERLAWPPPPKVAPEWRETDRPAVRAAEPVNQLSARALEIAAARLGQPADAAFASLVFDQAVAFANPRGVAQAGPAQPGAIFTPSSAGAAPALVEQVAEGGLIVFESLKGKLSRIFRPASEMAGTFSEIPEALRPAPTVFRRPGDILLELPRLAAWTRDSGDPALGPGCNPPNPKEDGFGTTLTPSGTGLLFGSASNTADCCKCVRRGTTIRLPAPVTNKGLLLQGSFTATRGARDPYSVGSVRVDLLSKKALVGSVTLVAEHRENNNCFGLPSKEVILKSGAPFSISLQSMSILDWREIDEITIYLQGYACISGTNAVTLSNLTLSH